MSYSQYFEKLENIIIEDKGSRGLEKLAKNGDFYGSVKELYNSSTVMIVTGFCIKEAMIGETDGPLGAASLGSALLKLGKEVIFLTDVYSSHLLKSALDVFKSKIAIEVVPFEETEKFCVSMIEKYKPSHIVAVERPGRAADNRCYSMRGEDISSVVPNTDILFRKNEKSDTVTIAIGDGGNEVGMGNIKPQLAQIIPEGEGRLAVVKADYLVIAGVSNWGAHGLVAGLSLLVEDVLLHDEEIEKNVLKAMVEVGAVDGCSKKSEMTVDGLSLEINLNIVKELNDIIKAALEDDVKEVVNLRLVKHS